MWSSVWATIQGKCPNTETCPCTETLEFSFIKKEKIEDRQEKIEEITKRIEEKENKIQNQCLRNKSAENNSQEKVTKPK